MKISTLKNMGLYDLLFLIRQLQSFNEAFYAYVDENDTSIPDPHLRALVDNVSDLIGVEETLLNQTKAVADKFIESIENYDPEECTNDKNKQPRA